MYAVDFEAVIGLEVHVQLATETKMFCGCPSRIPAGKTTAEISANSNTCEICVGHPGTLPVLNQKAVDYAIRAGLATQCTVHPKSVFSRKNYFYPDLAKGYQISQFDLPICERGRLEIELKGGEKKEIKITRIHLEEDAGKNVHMEGFSLVNFNRAGVPLVEIVSEPDMRSSEEAGAYLRELYSIITAIGICDGNLQEGNFRCDANVSVRPRGQEKFGTRTEIKNVNSFRFVEKAIDYEITRQIQVIQSGGTIVQETRGFDSDNGTTTSLRSKEEAHDYRYFPEPDLIPLMIDQTKIEEIGKTLPELPAQKRDRFVKEFGLSPYDAKVITGGGSLSTLFDGALSLLTESKKFTAHQVAKPLANFVTGEIARLINEEGKEASESRLTARHLADLVPLSLENVVSSTNAKKVISCAWADGRPVEKIIQEENLKQMNDTSALEPIVDQIIKDSPQQVAQYRGGKDKLLGFFVGQTMKATKGQANPEMVQELIKKKLSS